VRKQALAWLLKTNTVVADEWVCQADDWVCQNPGMGDRSNISRAVGRFRRRKEKPVVELIKKLHVCTDWYLFYLFARGQFAALGVALDQGVGAVMALGPDAEGGEDSGGASLFRCRDNAPPNQAGRPRVPPVDS